MWQYRAWVTCRHRELPSHIISYIMQRAIPILSPFYAFPIFVVYHSCLTMCNRCFSYAGMATSKCKRFRVETILNYKEDLYLVKWVGYKDPTWEPTDNLDQCKEMIWNFTEVCNSRGGSWGATEPHFQH